MKFKALKDYFIREIGVNEEPQEAEGLFYIALEHVSGMARSRLLFNLEQEVKFEELEAYQHIIIALQQKKPIQYILEEAHFYGLTFQVNPAVLIPRAETEELVDWILDTVKSGPQKGTLLDVGTGSGCIAISLAKHLQAWEAFAMDISPAALEVARQNAIKNQVSLNLIEADALTYAAAQRFNLIVSNPPYIKEDEKAMMHPNVLEHEPHTALFVSNSNPLIFYKAIAELATTNLAAGGYLFFEINEYLGKETVAMLKDKGFQDLILKKDMQGKDRMICCKAPLNSSDDAV